MVICARKKGIIIPASIPTPLFGYGFAKYNIAGNSWASKTNISPATGGGCLGLYNNRIYMFGGYRYSVTNKVSLYDIASDTWSNQ